MMIRTKSSSDQSQHVGLRNKGSLLLITTVALFLVTTLAIAVISITSTALYMNDKQQSRTIALNIAESGAEDGALYLYKLNSAPTDTEPFDPFDGPVTLNGGQYSVTITPDDTTSSDTLRVFVITSIGTYRGVSKTVEIVIKQASFGRYAYFTDCETSSGGGEIWWRTGETVDGPVHSNNRYNSRFNINYTNSTSPIFLDMVTSAASSIDYVPGAPANETTYKKIFKNGAKGLRLGVDPIDLPNTDIERIQSGAWGGLSGYPSSSSTGVYLSGASNSGIYIVGDVETMALSLDGSGNQQIVITQKINKKIKTTTIVLDRYNNETTATGTLGSGSVSSMNSLINGVIYCTGNIKSLQGEMADNLCSDDEITTRSALTIATDVNNNKDITITGDLVYHTHPDKTLDSNAPANLAAGTMGLVARNITVSSSSSYPSDFEIDGVCLAGGKNTSSGSFSVLNSGTITPPPGKEPKLKILGGIIQKYRGPVGTFNSSTGKLVTGYAKNYVYDPRMAQSPPPYYPTTGKYDRISWRVVPDSE
ncbi:DUF4900 domain-containing protein [bacterium]|nr:DUF4900 domain-containing protein [bacterium]